MKTIMLDTNAYAHFKRGKEAILQQIRRAESILLPVPVLAELRVGFKGGTKEQENLRELETFLANPRVSVAILTEQTALVYAEIYTSLKRKGSPIPLNDVWIAAAALEQGAILMSEDAHFRQIEGLLLNVPL